MKKVFVVALIVAVGFALGGISYAAWWGGGYGPGYGSQTDVKALRSFQKETLPLRDDLIAKRAEIQNEYTKDNPDQTRIATLQKEMIDLQTKIQDTAQKQGLSAWGPGWMMGGGYGPGWATGHRGYRMGYRGDYGSGYCPMW
ncbi:MAG: hypothetical protein PHU49_11925 [Syntrophorhabdaceae bacterium]|jgi:zinc resistance-associated protein|nr:hypothetical protein [Syntrophorhabdaceae bacterium]MDD5244714.1 hypothetical protein [Syntrophorhabdaceae bacterium]